MKSITFHCEVITPMFLAGADGKTPELRPPSIKGALRFWWRAMNGHLSLADLKKKETEIFGGGGENAGRSNLIIEVLNQPTNKNIINEKPLPHKENGFLKNAIQTGFEFDVKLTLSNELDVFSLNHAKNLFILVSLLGGLGNRSRRGFGSFKILKIDNENFIQPEAPDKIMSLIKTIGQINSDSNQDFPYLKEEIKIGNKPKSLINIGQITHDLKGKYGGYQYENSIGNSKPRFSSPIYVSIIKKSDNNLYPVVTVLNTVPPKNGKVNVNVQQEFINSILQ